MRCRHHFHKLQWVLPQQYTQVLWTQVWRTVSDLAKSSNNEETSISSIHHWSRSLVETPLIFRSIFGMSVVVALTAKQQVIVGILPEVYRKLIQWKTSGMTPQAHQYPQNINKDGMPFRLQTIAYLTRASSNSNNNMVYFLITTYAVVETSTITRFRVNPKFKIVAYPLTWAILWTSRIMLHTVQRL